MRGYASYEAFYQDCEINASCMGILFSWDGAKMAIYRKGTILS